ncbi:MAG: hypothetical protein KIS91_04590 [Anaerolineae bacterium]|nr:hypothetical protein [Anaerolineae bacterium]
MRDRLHHRLQVYVRWLRRVARRGIAAARRGWQRVHQRCRRIPIEVLVADRARRRAVERDLRAGLKRLRRALGVALPQDTAIIVQHVIATERQVAGCYQVGQRSDGGHFALIRLALQVNGRALARDELLAALAEQCIGIATQQSGALSVVIPIDLEPPRPADDHRLSAPRHDPLAPSSNGRQATAPRPSA